MLTLVKYEAKAPKVPERLSVDINEIRLKMKTEE